MTLWSGGFGADPDELMWEYTTDDSDRRMLVDDLRGSMAHVAMLVYQEILSEAEGETLQGGLAEILAEADAFEFLDSDEDVHTATERRLVELVGDVGKKLHTGRSRNDQVALDLRLYLSRAGHAQIERLGRMNIVMVDQAEKVGSVVVPSYTHMQQAQAVPLAHHFLAYAEMFRRDAERMQDALGRIEVSPLGAGATGGSSLPLDPAVSTEALGWTSHFVNSMDAVASRDFVSEYTYVCAQAMAHLSRLAEEIILWSTREFGWVKFPDTFTMGSSAMPQKKNPDVVELVRGRSAGVIGDLTSIMTLQKGLPMTYNRDLQEDKRIVFHADDVLAGSLETLGTMMVSATFDPPAPAAAVTALDLAELLVERGVAFRTAHETVGALIRYLAADGRSYEDITAEDLAAVSEYFLPEDLSRMDPTTSVQNRQTPGGGSFESVEHQIKQHRQIL